MKVSQITLPFMALCCGAGLALGADSTPSSQVTDALAKLKAATNYSWTSTLKMADSQFNIGPTKGQATSDGYAHMTQDFNDNTTEVYLKGDKVALQGQEGGWQLIGPDAGFESFFAAGMARNGALTQEVGIILKDAGDLKAMEAGVIGADFTTNGASDMMAFGPRRPAGAEGGFPPPKNAKGSVKFWVKDGQLVKYETHLTGTVTFGDNDMNQDQTRTVEIHDVGTTKLDIPADAKKLFEGK